MVADPDIENFRNLDNTVMYQVISPRKLDVFKSPDNNHLLEKFFETMPAILICALLNLCTVTTRAIRSSEQYAGNLSQNVNFSLYDSIETRYAKESSRFKLKKMASCFWGVGGD